ncbi:hypothetical protein WIW90_07425 [Sulfolobaceae archaeon RB850M]|jgi:hypothetical protein
MVSFPLKLFFILIGVGQILFIYELISVLTKPVVYPDTIYNYMIGFATLTVLIVIFLLNLNTSLKYISFLLYIPVVNVFVITILIYLLKKSKLWSFIIFITWFANLILTLLSPLPLVLFFGEGKYFINYMVLSNVVSAMSLLLVGFYLLRVEKSIRG